MFPGASISASLESSFGLWARPEIGGEGAIHLLERALADEQGSVKDAAEMLAKLTEPE